MDYLTKGNADLVRFVNNIWEKMYFVYIEKVLDLGVQLMKNGGKSIAFIILVSVFHRLMCISEVIILYC